jgi:hypothetical protein
MTEESEVVEANDPRALDPFSVEALRLSQNFDDAIGAQKLLTVVPVRKPNRQEWFMVRPGDEWQLDTAVFELKEERETYLVAPDLRSHLSNDVSPRRLRVCINRRNGVFLWPMRLPGSDGRSDNWIRSALAAAEQAETKWTKLQADMALGVYSVFVGSDELPPPEWPEVTFQGLLDLAFSEFKITTLDHPAIQRLQGKI